LSSRIAKDLGLPVFTFPTWSIFDTRLQLPYTSSRGRFAKVSEGLQGMNELVAKELA